MEKERYRKALARVKFEDEVLTKKFMKAGSGLNPSRFSWVVYEFASGVSYSGCNKTEMCEALVNVSRGLSAMGSGLHAISRADHPINDSKVDCIIRALEGMPRKGHAGVNEHLARISRET